MIDLGEHRLRDLSEPVRVFQIRHPDLRASFPPLRSLEHYPGNLPLQHSSLVGREEDLARVAQALEMFPVVTLTGVGGVGKTRLALQVAAEVLPQFKDGAWLCELASVRDPDWVAEEVAGVFQVSARPGMSLEVVLPGQAGTPIELLWPPDPPAASRVGPGPHVQRRMGSWEGRELGREECFPQGRLTVYFGA